MQKDLASKIDSIRVLGPDDEIAHLDAELKIAEQRIAELESTLRAVVTPALPTPEQWNKANTPRVIDPMEFAPVSCPQCGTQMFYPYHREPLSQHELVRCSSRRACVQTSVYRKI